MTEAVIVALIVAIPPFLLSLMALILNIINKKQINSLHIQINSRMDEWMKTAKALSRQEGAEAQRNIDNNTKTML